MWYADGATFGDGKVERSQQGGNDLDAIQESRERDQRVLRDALM